MEQKKVSNILVREYGKDASKQFLATTLFLGARHFEIVTDVRQDTDLKCLPFNVDSEEVIPEINSWISSLWSWYVPNGGKES